ncbi:MAG: hypothetical protein ACOX59_06965 [Bacteroidales bacterium]|jgi:hypothetical protein|nr:hypothetical protein [Bacteroidota bacterium]
MYLAVSAPLEQKSICYEEKKEEPDEFSGSSYFVPRAGIEPAWK